MATAPCLRVSKAVREVLERSTELGHSLWLSCAADESRVIWCSRCNAYMSGNRAIKLRRQCIAASSRVGYGPTTGKRLRKQKHPVHLTETGKAVQITAATIRWLLGRVEEDPPTDSVAETPQGIAAVVPSGFVGPYELGDGALSDVESDPFNWGFGFD